MTYLLLCVLLTADEHAVSGTARHATSANFQIDCRSQGHDARQVALHCEQWRDRLLATWRPQDAPIRWKVTCQVVVHSSRNSFVNSVGRGGLSSFGSSWLEFEKELVSKRQVDLLPAQSGELSALAHELTHVLVADYFGGKQLPRWADEGMAILADNVEKRQLHQRDLKLALSQRNAFHAAELLAVTDYPATSRIPAFYGQSASVVAFLCRRDSPAKFLEFVQLAMKNGHETSIREVYGLRGHAELEQLWRADFNTAIDSQTIHLASLNSSVKKSIVQD